MSKLTKKRVHWYEKNNGVVEHDEDVDVLTSADAVTFDDGDTLQRKYDDKVLARTSDVGNLKGLSTTNKSSLVDAVNEVVTSDASNKSSIEKHVANKLNPHGVTKSQVGLGNADNTSDVNKPVSTAQQNAINSALSTAKEYADTKVANLVGAAPETLDTLEEVAQALAENDDVVEALNNAIGSKANQIDFDSHISDKNNPHGVTAEQTPFDKNISGLNASNVQGAIDELKGTIGYTRKNLLENKLTTQTLGGVTFTVNADKSISLSDTSTRDFALDINTSVTLDKGTYIFSGFPINHGDSRLSLYTGDRYYLLHRGIDSVEFTLDKKTTCRVFVVIVNGTPCDNAVIKPMIRYASITDDTYEPYVEDVNTRLSDTVLPKYKKIALNSVGWYRIAKIELSTEQQAKGSSCNSCDIELKRDYASTINEYHKIQLVSVRDNSSFANETSGGATGGHLITKIRHVYDTTNTCYLEIYYSGTYTNNIRVTLSNHMNVNGEVWQLIEPIATSETVSNVTVLGSHDFALNYDVQTQVDSKISKNLFSTYPSFPNGTPTMLASGTTYEIGFAQNRAFLMTLYNEYNESSVFIVETGRISNTTKCRVTQLKGGTNYFVVTPLTLTTLSIECKGANCYPTYMCIGGC